MCPFSAVGIVQNVYEGRHGFETNVGSGFGYGHACRWLYELRILAYQHRTNKAWEIFSV